MKLLEGKIAIVTGAARGIGESIAIKLAAHGAHIAFTYVSDNSAEKAKTLVLWQKCVQRPGSKYFQQTDTPLALFLAWLQLARSGLADP